jgi:hypothetical protein
MPSIKHFPPVALTVAAGRLLPGRIRIPKDRTGKLLVMENGEEYYIFSDVQVTSTKSRSAKSRTVLRVRFKFDR